MLARMAMVEFARDSTRRSGVASTVYGPRDQWPRHPQKDLNEQAQKARSLGWSAKPKESHGGFVLICPTGECRVRIDSTPRNPTRKAKEVDRAIRHCSHSSTHRESLQEALEYLGKAERLIRAAEELLRAKQLFGKAIELNTSVDGAIECEDKAGELLRAAGASDAGAADVPQISECAERPLESARQELRARYVDKPPHPEVDDAWKRCKGLRDRLRELKKQVQKEEG